MEARGELSLFSCLFAFLGGFPRRDMYVVEIDSGPWNFYLHIYVETSDSPHLWRISWFLTNNHLTMHFEPLRLRKLWLFLTETENTERLFDLQSQLRRNVISSSISFIAFSFFVHSFPFIHLTRSSIIDGIWENQNSQNNQVVVVLSTQGWLITVVTK